MVTRELPTTHCDCGLVFLIIIKKGAPVHVKAAIKYNDLLKYYNLNNHEEIRGSEKIKWVYLKNNEFGIESLAFKGYDDPNEIVDFIQKYIDYEKLYRGALEKKIKMFYEALNWDMPVDKKNTLDRFLIRNIIFLTIFIR